MTAPTINPAEGEGGLRPRDRRTRGIVLGHLAWVAVFAFWLLTTRDHHPRFALAVIVTASLVTAFALAVDVNHFLLVPRFWRRHRFGTYASALLATMAALTALALVVIRVSYLRLHGPDPDLYGAYKHFAIDLFGTAVHVGLAAGVVWAWRRGDRLAHAEAGGTTVL